MNLSCTSALGTGCEFAFDKTVGSLRLEGCCDPPAIVSAADEPASFPRLAALLVGSDIRALFFAAHNSLPLDSALCSLFLPARQERLW